MLTDIDILVQAGYYYWIKKYRNQMRKLGFTEDTTSLVDLYNLSQTLRSIEHD